MPTVLAGLGRLDPERIRHVASPLIELGCALHVLAEPRHHGRAESRLPGDREDDVGALPVREHDDVGDGGLPRFDHGHDRGQLLPAGQVALGRIVEVLLTEIRGTAPEGETHRVPMPVRVRDSVATPDT